MKLLVRFARDLERLWAVDWLFHASLIGSLVGLELLGRETETDLHDLMCFFWLAMLGTLVGMRHQQKPMAWVSGIVQAIRRFGRWARTWTFEIGMDLRGQPRVKRGTPPIVMILTGVMATWVLMALYLSPRLPHNLRHFLSSRFYLLYIAIMGFSWLCSMMMIVLAVFFPTAFIHDSLVARHTGPEPRSRRIEFLAFAAFFAAIISFGMAFSVGTCLLVCLGLLMGYIAICWLPHRSDVRFLWRPYQSVQVRSLSWSQWVTWEFLLITLTISALVLTNCGDRIWRNPPGPELMPVSTMLGFALAWLAPGTLATLLIQMTVGRLRDPARPAAPSVYLDGDCPALSRSLSRRGWNILSGDRRDPLVVPLRVVSRKTPGSDDSPTWPLAITAEDVNDPAFWQRIRRRDEITKRRKFMSSLEVLLKRAGERRKRSGQGFWLAPHFWFVSGLLRDSQLSRDDEIDLGEDTILSSMVGPPFHQVMPRSVRHHLYDVFRAIQVDLLFVEDGITFRQLRRVLRVLFEVYDIHGGRRPIEESDFRGLPKTRVIVHEYQFDEPFQSRKYPEPKYDYLGRARILHVFRDRGENEELMESPFDFTHGRSPMTSG